MRSSLQATRAVPSPSLAWACRALPPHVLFVQPHTARKRGRRGRAWGRRTDVWGALTEMRAAEGAEAWLAAEASCPAARAPPGPSCRALWCLTRAAVCLWRRHRNRDLP